MKFPAKKLVACKECGETVTWCQSKNGKWYLVNIANGLGDTVAFHSQTCNKAVSTPVTEATPVTEPTGAVAQEATKTESPHMLTLAELELKMREFEVKAQNFESKYIKPVTEQVETLTQKETELFTEFQKKIAEVREEKQAKNNELYNLKLEFAGLKDELSKLSKQHAKTLQMIAAEQKMAEIEAKFLPILNSAPFKDSLLPFQLEDVRYICSAFELGKSGVLNANDMGLGKTFESAAADYILSHMFYEKYGRMPSVLWLTKKSLMKTNANEIRKWNPERKAILVSGDGETRGFQVNIAVANNILVIANYEALNTTPELRDVEWDIIFMDEVHKLKGGANPTPTQVWKNAKQLCEKAKFLIPLSGTPIQNHPKEMWSYLHLFDPVRFPNVKRFEREYCYGWGEGIKVNWESLINAMKDQVIRRKTDDPEVNLQLPDAWREFRYIELTPKQRELYNQLREHFFVWLDEQKETSLSMTAVIAQLTYLRQINLWPGGIKVNLPDGSIKHLDVHESGKIDEAIELLEELIKAGEQVVVFSAQFNEVLYELERRINAEEWTFNGTDDKVVCRTVTGADTTKGLLGDIERDFQDGKIHIILGNMKTVGEGLNLQTASHAIFMDLWWTPASNEQAEKRLHRQGQKKHVTYHIFQAEDTVDSFIAAKLEEKSEMVEGIMNSQSLKKGLEWKEILQGLI